LVTKYKGKDATAEVYKVDTVLLAEMRNHERQAAEELGPVGYKERIQYPQRGRDNRALERRPSPGAGSMGKRQLHAPAAARTTITAGTIALEISNRNARVQACRTLGPDAQVDSRAQPRDGGCAGRRVHRPAVAQICGAAVVPALLQYW
jgi:hypothetical protein